MSNIYIYIKTPQIEKSSRYGHIVEHCILNGDIISPEDFYVLCDIKAESYYGYTRYDLYKKIDIENFIQKICSPLDKNVFAKEMVAFQEETENEVFSDILKRKVEKLMYGDTKNLGKKTLSWKEIESYHKKYYKRCSMVICDSEYKILENNLASKKP